MMNKMTLDEYFLRIASVVAMRSSCCRRQVGAILVKDGRIISTGYNGTPRGIQNCDEGGCPRCNNHNIASSIDLHECICCHAEENTLSQAAYHGISVKDSSLYTTLFPCKLCAKMLINSGVKHVVYQSDYPTLQEVAALFHMARVRFRRIVVSH